MTRVRATGVGCLYHVFTKTRKHLYKKYMNNMIILLKDTVEKAKIKYGFVCLGFLIIDNQVHMIIQTPEQNNISLIMQVLNKNMADKCNKLLNRKGSFWSTRFYSEILQSKEQLLSCLLAEDKFPKKEQNSPPF